MLRHGLDPLSFVRYLGSLGQITAVTTLFDAMPETSVMDPEACYLGMELDFTGQVDKQTIENVFDYLRDDCAIRILPPHSRISDYIALIDGLPEDNAQLGDLLVTSGALTRRELEEGLLLQQNLDETGPEHARKLGEILVSHGLVQNELVGAALDKAYDESKEARKPSIADSLTAPGAPRLTPTTDHRELLEAVIRGVSTLPEGFDIHPKLKPTTQIVA